MRVWIAFRGYDYEGSEPLGVYATEKLAQARINEERREDLAPYVNQQSLLEWNTMELREWHKEVVTGVYYELNDYEVIE